MHFAELAVWQQEVNGGMLPVVLSLDESFRLFGPLEFQLVRLKSFVGIEHDLQGFHIAAGVPPLVAGYKADIKRLFGLFNFCQCILQVNKPLFHIPKVREVPADIRGQ
jgi:hypothetical protein